MPTGWRFRTGWGGVLVLQRKYGVQPWRDATAIDLMDYAQALVEGMGGRNG